MARAVGPCTWQEDGARWGEGAGPAFHRQGGGSPGRWDLGAAWEVLPGPKCLKGGSDRAGPPAGCGIHTLGEAGLPCHHLLPTPRDTSNVTMPLQRCPQLCPSSCPPPLPPLAIIQSTSCSITRTCCVSLDAQRPTTRQHSPSLNPSDPSSPLFSQSAPNISDWAFALGGAQLRAPHS